jgi:hypothetical protein
VTGPAVGSTTKRAKSVVFNEDSVLGRSGVQGREVTLPRLQGGQTALI